MVVYHFQKGTPMKNGKKIALSDSIGIGDVSKICGIPEYTIRYWEREFEDELSPSRTEGMQRRYSDGDIDKLLHIKNLLWVDNFSIKGAKRVLKGNLILSNMADEKIPAIKNTHALALKIAQIISRQLTHLEPAA